MSRLPLLILLALPQTTIAAAPFTWPEGQGPQAKHQLLIVLDGLRPDYVRPEWMPHLHRLAQEGVWFEEHHAVYPTVTRVNAASISTGAYPETHGLMDNTVYFPSISQEFTLSTAEYTNLRRIKDSEHRLLEEKTIGEFMDLAGKRLLVCSSGSSGSAYLLNPEVAGVGIINVDVQLPEELEQRVHAQIGDVPEEKTPNGDRNRWVVDAYLQFGLRDFQADAAILWITDPDHTAHTEGMGSPKCMTALSAVDSEIGRILAAIDEAGAKDQVNIVVTSDHGFTTMKSDVIPLKVLYQYMGEQGRAMSDVVLAGFGVYFKSDHETLAPGLVKALQQTDWVGSIYSPPGAANAAEGIYPGTLSMSSINYTHPRGPHVLLAPQWSDEKNADGFAGTSALPGIAGHGGDSPYEIHNTLIVAGPDFAQHTRIASPSSNVDLAPTLCALQMMDIPNSMQGRVLSEAFRHPVPVGLAEPQSATSQAALEATTYTVRGHWTTLDGHRYYDYGKASRTAPSIAPE